MTLMELSDREQHWLAALTAEDAEGNPIGEEEQTRIIEEFVAADAEFKDKVDRYIELIEGFAVRGSWREDQAERLNELARRDNSVAQKLRARLLAVMQLRGESALETDRHQLRIQPNGGATPLVIPERWKSFPADAPERFCKQRLELDMKALRAAIEAGEAIPGCELGTRGVHLRIA